MTEVVSDEHPDSFPPKGLSENEMRVFWTLEFHWLNINLSTLGVPLTNTCAEQAAEFGLTRESLIENCNALFQNNPELMALFLENRATIFAGIPELMNPPAVPPDQPKP